MPRSPIVGLPLRVDHRLFNCAAVVCGGTRARRRAQDLPAELRRVLRGAPVQRRPTARSRPACACSAPSVPFGADLIFEARQPAAAEARMSRSARTCGCRSRRRAMRRWPARRCWSTCRRRTSRSASRDYRHRLVSLQSARCLAAYLYSSAGLGESTTDLAWDGQALIYENGDLLAESERFVGRLALHQRRRRPRAAVARAHAAEHRSASRSRSTRARVAAFRTRRASSCRCRRRCRCALQRTVERFPVRAGRRAPARRALQRGLQHPGAGAGCSAWRRPASAKLVIGVSGGLDSTHALLVCAAGDGPAGPAAHQHPRPTPCRASRPATRTLDAGAGA